MERESDRLLAQLRRQLRAELMHEFMLKPGVGGAPTSALPTIIVGLEPKDSRVKEVEVQPGGTIVSVMMLQRICRPYRLVIEPADAEGWEVSGARMGTVALFETERPVPASAFRPLPHWIEDPSGIAPETLAQLMRETPLENVRRLTGMPGLQISLSLWRSPDARPAKQPRHWMLAHVPPEHEANEG